MQATVRIGTSGWHYDHWKGPFYPESMPGAEMLQFYASRFRSVEINNSFYHLPSAKAFESWRRTVSSDFRFSIKASRFITHMKKLKDPKRPLNTFLSRVEILGKTLGPVLFQLPPHWACNLERLEDFLESLPKGHRYVFEMRDRSWHNEDVYRRLSRRRAAFCVYQLAGFQSPLKLTTDFAYVRLHGPSKSAYSGNYHRSSLKKWAKTINEWSKDLRSIYVYFDNDQRGYAVNNALALQALLD